MSAITADDHGHAKDESGNPISAVLSFFGTYVFSRDHKIIGLQFLFSTLLWFLVGGLLALGIRLQLAGPWEGMPVIGNLLFSGQGGPADPTVGMEGQISPEFYTTLFTMHATVMIFFW